MSPAIQGGSGRCQHPQTLPDPMRLSSCHRLFRAPGWSPAASHCSWCARPHSPGPSASKPQPVLLPTRDTTIHDTVKNPSHAAKCQPAFIFSTHRKDSLKNNTDSVKEHFCIATCPALCRKKPLLARLMEDRHLSDVFGKMMDLHRSVPSQLAWSPL